MSLTPEQHAVVEARASCEESLADMAERINKGGVTLSREAYADLQRQHADLQATLKSLDAEIARFV